MLIELQLVTVDLMQQKLNKMGHLNSYHELIEAIFDTSQLLAQLELAYLFFITTTFDMSQLVYFQLAKFTLILIVKCNLAIPLVVDYTLPKIINEEHPPAILLELLEVNDTQLMMDTDMVDPLIIEAHRQHQVSQHQQSITKLMDDTLDLKDQDFKHLAKHK